MQYNKSLIIKKIYYFDTGLQDVSVLRKRLVVFIFEIRTFIIFLEEHNVGKKWKSKDEGLG